MELNRLDFLKALKAVLPGIEQKESLLVGSNCFVFMGEKIHTCNGYMAISIQFPTGIEGALPAKELYETINRFKSDVVEINKEGNSLLLKSGRSKANIMFTDETVLRQVNNIYQSDIEYTALPKDFMVKMHQCIIKGNRGKLEGVFIDGNLMLSTDESEIIKAYIEGTIKKTWLSTKLIREIIKVKDAHSYALGSSWIYFKGDAISFACKRLDETVYPIEALTSFMDSYNKETMIIEGFVNQELNDVLASAEVFATEDAGANLVDFIVSDSGISIHSRTSAGVFEDNVEYDFTAKEKVEFTIDAIKLRRILDSHSEVHFEVHKQPNGIMVLLSDDNVSFLIGTK